MPKYFAILFGNDLNLANTELQAILDYIDEGVSKIPVKRFVTFDSNHNPIQFIRNRAALVRETGYIVQEAPSGEALIASISKDSLKEYVSREQTFSVRVRNIGDKQESRSPRIEKRIGKVIEQQAGASVSLENPDVRFLVVIDDHRQVLVTSEQSIARESIEERRPRNRAFFHPSIMNTSLARAMCNIAKIDRESLVVDPFCGAGGILSEAVGLASSVVGIDRNWTLLAGARENLKKLKRENYSLVQADARRLSMSSCDSVVTDPPYGRTSSTRGVEAIRLVRAFLEFVLEEKIVEKSLCICASLQMGVSELVMNMGLEIRYHVKSRVHKSLTREVICIEF
ncbi:methyltransferase domain-containing protein [Candidatus Thorarchaeota archaeon]|nr:MAG: methyltransferase domain-containing protein [Candidatus Thorarchaeota archaeon]